MLIVVSYCTISRETSLWSIKFCKIAAISVDCQLSEWGQCSTTCGAGKKHRSIEVSAQNGGNQCEDLTQDCNQELCPGT